MTVYNSVYFSMEVEEIMRWCEEKGVDSKKAIELSNVSVDVIEEIIFVQCP